MVVVDTHCHASLDWYEPIETLLYEMDRNGVDHAVLVQINGQFDNAYQFECVRRYPGRFANVVLVDTDRPDTPQQLEQLAERGATGVRLRPPARRVMIRWPSGARPTGSASSSAAVATAPGSRRTSSPPRFRRYPACAL